MSNRRRNINILLVIVVLILIFNYVSNYKYEEKRKSHTNHYVNDLYDSDDYIYNNYLNDNEKKMYDLIVDNSIKHNSKITIDLNEFNCIDYNACGDIVNVASEAVWVDHPELMNYAAYEWKYNDKNGFRLKLRFAYHLKIKDKYGEFRIKRYLEKIKKATDGMTDEEKIKYVYNWMSNHSEYNSYFFFLDHNQSAYDAMVKKYAVCAGFAKSCQMIFAYIGIKSYIVTGYSTGPHMWNIVKYDDKYYYFDSTVGVGYKNRKNVDHLGGLRQTFMNGYTMDYEGWYPKIETTNMFNN